MTCRSALRLLCAFVLLAGAAFPGVSLSLDEIDANASLLFIGSNPQGGYEDPTLGVAPLIGASVPLQISGPFFFEPDLELLGWYYQWNTLSNASEITQQENGLGFFTIGALLGVQAGVRFPVARDLTLGGTVGVDFFLRVPAELQNTTSTVKDNEKSAVSWFYGSGRFFYPETRLFLRWHISDPVDLLFNLRAFYPAFHLWDGAGQPFWDSLMVSAGVGFAIRLKRAPAPAAAPAAAAPSGDATGAPAAGAPSPAAPTGPAPDGTPPASGTPQ